MARTLIKLFAFSLCLCAAIVYGQSEGPASSLYGSTEVGGLINDVTKKPKEVLDGEMQVRFGSFVQKMVNGELTGPITDKLLARAGFYFEDHDSFRNNAGSRNLHAVANLLYNASDKHRFGCEHSEQFHSRSDLFAGS